MRSKWARVANFKSVDDSESVEFELDAACFADKGKSGKTAFLEALYRSRVESDPSGQVRKVSAG